MMNIHAYDGLNKSEITKLRTTSNGKKYSLNHPKELLVPMRYTPNRDHNRNSQGWERSPKYYWTKILESNPQCLSPKNQARITNDKFQTPKVDKTFIESFPQYKDFNRNSLYHHHIGGNGVAVAAPVDAHKGSGEIHKIEQDLGITRNALKISEQCHEICAKDQKYYGQTSLEFQKKIYQQKNQTKTAFNSRISKPSSTVNDKTLVDNKQVDQKKSKEFGSSQDKPLSRLR